jgi:hypothetical protein
MSPSEYLVAFSPFMNLVALGVLEEPDAGRTPANLAGFGMLALDRGPVVVVLLLLLTTLLPPPLFV